MNDTKRRIHDELGAWLAAPTMLVVPIIVYLKFNGYPLYAAEALLAVGTFLAAGFVLSLGGRLVWLPVRVVIMTLTSFAILNLVILGAGSQDSEATIEVLAGVVGHGFVALASMVVIIGWFFFGRAFVSPTSSARWYSASWGYPPP